MNKIVELVNIAFEYLVEYLVIFPLLVIFWTLVYIDKLLAKLKLCYYNLFGIEYVMIHDKFTSYPSRINKR